MQLIETRGNDGQKPSAVTFSHAITNPSASFGGLYVPESFPDLGLDFLSKHQNSTYAELAKAVVQAFGSDIDPDVLDEALALYEKFDDSHNPVPLTRVKPDLFISELYHGPTRAFKDMALQPFGYILSRLAQEKGEDYLILAATSGDTGPAALETFADQPHIRVVCLYPDGGTSDVQRLQMVTNGARNLNVLGIRGNFDDAQSALKSLLADADFHAALKEKHISLSAANSVNIGRILFQIIYHIWSYLELLRQKAIKLGDNIYLAVPSGNFGNALGAYYAKKSGLPIEKILIASNVNHILTDLIASGEYDLRGRSLKQTCSPAMDILKSSNVERLLYDICGPERTRTLMEQLESRGHYRLSVEETEEIQKSFAAAYSDDDYGKTKIKEYLESGYLMDPHTATCLRVYESLPERDRVCVAYSTAEWTKFAPNVLEAISDTHKSSDIDALHQISKQANVKTPAQIEKLFTTPIVHKKVIEKDRIVSEILGWL